MKALTTLGSLFAAPLSAARLFAVRFFSMPLGVSKSKLICIVKGFLAMDKHRKEPFSLHLNRVLKQDLKHEALNYDDTA